VWNHALPRRFFAAKERKEHKDKDLCCFSFAVFAILCGNSSSVAAGRAGLFVAFRGHVIVVHPAACSVKGRGNREIREIGEPASTFGGKGLENSWNEAGNRSEGEEKDRVRLRHPPEASACARPSSFAKATEDKTADGTEDKTADRTVDRLRRTGISRMARMETETNEDWFWRRHSTDNGAEPKRGDREIREIGEPASTFGGKGLENSWNAAGNRSEGQEKDHGLHGFHG